VQLPERLHRLRAHLVGGVVEQADHRRRRACVAQLPERFERGVAHLARAVAEPPHQRDHRARVAEARQHLCGFLPHPGVIVVEPAGHRDRHRFGHRHRQAPDRRHRRLPHVVLSVAQRSLERPRHAAAVGGGELAERGGGRRAQPRLLIAEQRHQPRRGVSHLVAPERERGAHPHLEIRVAERGQEVRPRLVGAVGIELVHCLAAARRLGGLELDGNPLNVVE
jgi:hypothetical protein